jgi:hypothetical protein
MNDAGSFAPIAVAAPQPHPRIRRVLITGAAVLATAGLAVWMVQMGRNASAQAFARRSLSSVAMALGDYSDVHGHLPYAVVSRETAGLLQGTDPPEGTGVPHYSWRVEIIPFLEAWHGTWDPSQPWDSPANRQLVERSSFYAFGGTGPEGYPQSFPGTNVLAITGPGTAFGDGRGRPMALKDVPPATIIAVETRSSGIPWPAPGDFDVRTMPRTVCARDGKGISSLSAGGFHVVFADRWVWLLSDKVPFETIAKFLTTAEAGKHSRDELLGPFVLHRGP